MKLFYVIDLHWTVTRSQATKAMLHEVHELAQELHAKALALLGCPELGSASTVTQTKGALC